MLSYRLKGLRERKGITQSQLAEVLGITQQAVARWERNKSEPDTSTLKQLSKYFNVSIDYLLDNKTDEKYESEPTGFSKLNSSNQQIIRQMIEAFLTQQAQVSPTIVQANKGGRNLLVKGGKGNSYKVITA